MTKYRTNQLKHVEIKESFVETYTTCDFCKQDIKEVSCKSDNNSVDIKIEAKIGNVWEGGYADDRNGYYIDVCDVCFCDKLKPAVEKAGATWNEFTPESAYLQDKYSDYYVQGNK